MYWLGKQLHVFIDKFLYLNTQLGLSGMFSFKQVYYADFSLHDVLTYPFVYFMFDYTTTLYW